MNNAKTFQWASAEVERKLRDRATINVALGQIRHDIEECMIAGIDTVGGYSDELIDALAALHMLLGTGKGLTK